MTSGIILSIIVIGGWTKVAYDIGFKRGKKRGEKIAIVDSKSVSK